MHTYRPVTGGFEVGHFVMVGNHDIPPLGRLARMGYSTFGVSHFVALGFLRAEESAMRRVAYLNGDCGDIRWQSDGADGAVLWDVP